MGETLGEDLLSGVLGPALAGEDRQSDSQQQAAAAQDEVGRDQHREDEGQGPLAEQRFEEAVAVPAVLRDVGGKVEGDERSRGLTLTPLT